MRNALIAGITLAVIFLVLVMPMPKPKKKIATGGCGCGCGKNDVPNTTTVVVDATEPATENIFKCFNQNNPPLVAFGASKWG